MHFPAEEKKPSLEVLHLGYRSKNHRINHPK